MDRQDGVREVEVVGRPPVDPLLVAPRDAPEHVLQSPRQPQARVRLQLRRVDDGVGVHDGPGQVEPRQPVQAGRALHERLLLERDQARPVVGRDLLQPGRREGLAGQATLEERLRVADLDAATVVGQQTAQGGDDRVVGHRVLLGPVLRHDVRLDQDGPAARQRAADEIERLGHRAADQVGVVGPAPHRRHLVHRTPPASRLRRHRRWGPGQGEPTASRSQRRMRG